MKTVKISIILMIAIVAVASAAFAAPVRIGTLEQNISDPVRVALDAQGNIYVTEAQRDLVLVYTSKGQHKTGLSVPRPLGVAVDGNGTIYVSSGNQRTKNPVYVFTPDFVKAGCLGGASCAEFVKPIDVAVDGKGNVYVVDNDPDYSVVKVYDGAGSLIRTIAGSGASRLNKPMSVAIDDTAGEIIISDQPDVIVAGQKAIGARIQAFDGSGIAVRTIGQYGIEVGQFKEATDIAIDAKGQLYVTDGALGVTNIINASDGNIVGILYDAGKPGYNPNGVVVSKNGLAYVVMQKGEGSKGRIDIYALEGYVTMAAAPAALMFEARQFSGNPSAQTVSVSNSGSGTLNWTASKSQSWIVLGQDAGTAGPNGSSGLPVGIDISALKAGIYTGTVAVVSDFGQTESVGVSVNVLNPLILNISKSTMTFTAKKGKTAAAQSLATGIDNVTTATAWSAKSDSTWLSVTPASGTATAASAVAGANVTINTAGMGVGTYKGAITVSAPGAIGDGSAVMVMLTITPTTKITVNTNNENAKFSVSGPSTYNGSGSSWSVEDVPAGDYKVNFEPVAGYRKPKAAMGAVPADGEVSFSGNYTSFADIAARRNILVAGALGVKARDSEVSVYSNTGALSQAIDLSANYGASVAVADVDNDGAEEIIVSAAEKGSNPATVTVMKADRTVLNSFVPFANANAVRVAAGDMDGNGSAEIVVIPAPTRNGAAGTAAVYTYDSASAKMIEVAAVTMYKKTSIVDVAVADINGDGKAELLTLAAFEGKSAGMVKAWSVSAAKGGWSAALINDITMNGEMMGAAVAGGDVDGDGVSEIIVGSAADAGGMLTIIKGDGTQTKVKVFGRKDVAGMTLAVADLDGDGKADLVAAPVLESGNAKKDGAIEVLNSNGTLMFSIDVKADGANVAIGELGL